MKQNKGSEKRKRGMKHSESSEKTKHGMKPNGESEKKERCREKQDEISEKLRPVKKVDSDSGDGQGMVTMEILDLVDGGGAENIPDQTQKEVVAGVKLGPVDGAKEIWEDHGKRNQDEEDADVTLDLVDGEWAENIPDENQKEVVTGVKLGPVDGVKDIWEDHGKRNQDEADGGARVMTRSQASLTTENWHSLEAPKRMRISPPPRSSLVEPYMAEPAGLDLRVERSGPRNTADVVQLPPAPPHRFYKPVTQRFYCAWRCHCRCGSCCGCHCICDWIRVSRLATVYFES